MNISKALERIFLVLLLIILQNQISFADGDTLKLIKKSYYKFTEKGLVKYKDDGDKTSELVVFKPEVIFKGKYEICTESSLQRFTVRNSRIGMLGSINKFIQYKFQLELSSDGKFNILDLYAKILPINGMSIAFGQLSVPLFNSYTISPGSLDFANRPFVGKYFTSTRDIGACISYVIKQKGFPISIEMGAFNGNGINNPKWSKSLAYGGRLSFGQQKKGFRATAKAMKMKEKDEEDYTIWGVDSRYENRYFKIEAEVMGKYNSFNEVHQLAYYIQGLYSFPINSSFIEALKPSVRWESMGNNVADSGFGVSRITSGINMVLKTNPFYTVLRLDYEHYFNNYAMSVFTEPIMNTNKITLELLFSF